MTEANMRDRPMLDEIEITPAMIEAAASALYEDDWGMEVPKVTAERALRRALAVAPWVGRVSNCSSPKRLRTRGIMAQTHKALDRNGPAAAPSVCAVLRLRQRDRETR